MVLLHRPIFGISPNHLGMNYLTNVKYLLAFALLFGVASAAENTTAAAAPSTPSSAPDHSVVSAASGCFCEGWLGDLTRRNEEASAWESWVFQGDLWAAGYDGYGLGGAGVSAGHMISDTQLLGLHAGISHGIGQLGMVNAGLSWRKAFSSQSWVGANVFYDFLSTVGGSNYGQIGVGLEYGWRRWTLRGNGYLPIHANLDDTDAVAGGVTSVWRGLDTELQYELFTQPRWIDGHLAAGFYWGQTPVNDQSASGLRLRGQLNFGQHVYVQGEWRQNGHEIGLEWRLLAGLRFSIGKRRVQAPAPLRVTQAAVAMSSAKAPHSVQPMASAKSAKAVQPLTSAKAPKPLFAPPPLAPTLLPAGMFQPVQRTPWPFVRRGGEAPCECIEGDLEF